MKFFKIILSLIFLLLTISCKSQKKDSLTIKIKEHNDMPLKMVVHKHYKDSALVDFYIPTAFKLSNNTDSDVKLIDSYLSIKGGNVSSGSVKVLKNKIISYGFRKINIDKKDSKNFMIYTSYKASLMNREKENILKNAKLSQFFSDKKREVFDLKKSENTLRVLREKVPDSLRGFIRLVFKDYSTKKMFSKNIKVNF